MKDRYDRKKGLKKMGSIIISVFLIISLCILSKANLVLINTVCLWILGGIYLTLFLYFGVFQYAIKTLTDKRVIISSVGCSTILSVLLVLFLPIRYGTVLKENQLENFWYQGEGVVIEHIEEKNRDSLGSVVWIEGIIQDGKDYNLYEIPLSEGWRFEEGRIVSDSSDAEPLQLKLPSKSPYRIFFRKQEDAGCVRIRIGKYQGIVDLYQKEYKQHFELEWNNIIELDMPYLKLKRILFYGLECCVVWILSFVLVTYLGNYNKKRKQRIHIYEKQE